MNTSPLISIITITYNAEDVLEKTIKSVIEQNGFDNYEYIIIDGGSKDGTIDIIKKYSSKITKWISHPDRGISHAFNKGLALSNGVYINMLNAGDSYIHNEVLSQIASKLNGDLTCFKHTSAINGKKSSHFLSTSKYKRSMIGHQSAFVNHNLHRNFGLYNESFKIRMDYEFFLRIIDNCKINYCNDNIVFYHPGISGSLKNKFRFEIEGLIAEYLHGRSYWSFILRLLIIPLQRTTILYIKTFIKRTLKINHVL